LIPDEEGNRLSKLANFEPYRRGNAIADSMDLAFASCADLLGKVTLRQIYLYVTGRGSGAPCCQTGQDSAR
jgi:hypothetical protein